MRRRSPRRSARCPSSSPLDGLVFHARDEYELAANWKIACENYLECYHCPVAHKGFSAAYDVDPDAYRLEPTGEHVLSQFAQTRDGRAGPGAVPFRLAEPQDQRLRGDAEPLDRAAAAGWARALERLPRLLLRRRRGRRPGSRSCSPSTGRWARRTAPSSSAFRKASVGDPGEGRLLAESEQLVARFQELVERLSRHYLSTRGVSFGVREGLGRALALVVGLAALAPFVRQGGVGRARRRSSSSRFRRLLVADLRDRAARGDHRLFVVEQGTRHDQAHQARW